VGVCRREVNGLGGSKRPCTSLRDAESAEGETRKSAYLLWQRQTVQLVKLVRHLEDVEEAYSRPTVFWRMVRKREPAAGTLTPACWACRGGVRPTFFEPIRFPPAILAEFEVW
jgi:hypothetical protein